MDMSLDLERLVQKMSERLIADAELLSGEPSVSEGSSDAGSCYRCTADVGCDHGYVSMYLVLRGISKSAIAMDVRKGPLSQAEGNVHEFGLEDKVSLRLSDGLSALKLGEADSLVIAGMGGRLMMSILDMADIRALGIRMGVLQPQSELMQFRQYIRQHGYCIADERIVFEDGKYYFPMLIDFFHESGGSSSPGIRELAGLLSDGGDISRDDYETALRLSDRYGVFNILRRDELLIRFLRHGLEVGRSILTGLDPHEHSDRYEEVNTELKDMELILAMISECH